MYIHICIYAYIYLGIHIYAYTCKYVWMLWCLYACLYTYVCICICILCIYIYMYIYIYIYTYAYTCKYVWMLWCLCAFFMDAYMYVCTHSCTWWTVRAMVCYGTKRLTLLPAGVYGLRARTIQVCVPRRIDAHSASVTVRGSISCSCGSIRTDPKKSRENCLWSRSRANEKMDEPCQLPQDCWPHSYYCFTSCCAQVRLPCQEGCAQPNCRIVLDTNLHLYKFQSCRTGRKHGWEIETENAARKGTTRQSS